MSGQYSYNNWSPPAQSNESVNGYFLERSHSARQTLERACELLPDEEVSDISISYVLRYSVLSRVQVGSRWYSRGSRLLNDPRPLSQELQEGNSGSGLEVSDVASSPSNSGTATTVFGGGGSGDGSSSQLQHQESSSGQHSKLSMESSADSRPGSGGGGEQQQQQQQK